MVVWSLIKIQLPTVLSNFHSLLSQAFMDSGVESPSDYFIYIIMALDCYFIFYIPYLYIVYILLVLNGIAFPQTELMPHMEVLINMQLLLKE